MAYLNPMKFNDYTWPHNPSTYSTNYLKKIVQHEYPDIDGVETEDLGNSSRIISGNGTFFGRSAYNDFKALEKVYLKKEPGRLIHPVWGNLKATFSKLSLKQEPLPYYVEYEFEFIEHTDINVLIKNTPSTQSNNSNTSTSNNSSNNLGTYVVKKGDTLSSIAKKYYNNANLWKKIADANKNLIKNPNLIQQGWKLVIPK